MTPLELARANLVALGDPWSALHTQLRARVHEWRAAKFQADADETIFLEECRAELVAAAKLECTNEQESQEGIGAVVGGDGVSSGNDAAGPVGPLGGRSDLESSCLSDPEPTPPPGRSACQLPPGSWLADVEGATEPFRRARAKAHRVKAVEALASRPTARTDLAGAVRARLKADWHLGRAKGSMERFGRVDACGVDAVVASCVTGCGVERRATAGCSCGRVCHRCRAEQARERQERFAEARHRYIVAAGRLGLLRKLRKGGRWGEKLLTLTVPHFRFDDVVAWPFYQVVSAEAVEKGIGQEHLEVVVRIELLLRAWRRFSIRLQRWGRGIRRLSKARIKWYRALEWTPGSDGLGHPHFHVWMLAPYLDKALLDEWWAASLCEVLGCEALPSPVVTDIKSIKQRPDEIRRELLKGKGHALRYSSAGGDVIAYADGWSIVEIEQGVRVSAEVAARVYEALDRRRMVQTSKQLLAPVLHVCPFCNGKGTTRVTIEKGKGARAHEGQEPFKSRDPPTCNAGRAASI